MRIRILTIALVSAVSLYADVSVSVVTSGLSASVKNTTPYRWKLGGISWINNGFKWKTAGGTMCIIKNDSLAPSQNRVTLYFPANLNQAFSTITPGGSMQFTHDWIANSTGASPVAGSESFWLRTSRGNSIPVDIGEDPITLDQIDALTKATTFYKETYRPVYADGFGTRATIKGGLFDTWKYQTQLQMAVPIVPVTVNNTAVTFLPADDLKHYWLTMAALQEYVGIDAQLLISLGLRESFAGTNLVKNNTQGGMVPYWEVESMSAIDRALSYPNLFPKFTIELTKATDATVMGIKANEFTAYYNSSTSGSTLKSAQIFNNAYFSSMMILHTSELYSQCRDIAWKQALTTAVDSTLGVSVVLGTYNIGNMATLPTVVALLNPTDYTTTCSKPDAHTLFPVGNGASIPQVISTMLSLVQASHNFNWGDGKSSTVINFNISKQLLTDLFFGDNGTVEVQGRGGILLHCWDPAAGSFSKERQLIWDRLNAAFTMLAGRAPGTDAGSISFRYDFLTVLRTVKDLVPISFSPFIESGDAATLIPQNSTGKFGTAIPYDSTPPVITFGPSYGRAGNVSYLVSDKFGIESMKWSVDSSWNVWNTLNSTSTSSTEREYTIDFSKAPWSSFAPGSSYWIMATDIGGESAILKQQIPFPVSVTPSIEKSMRNISWSVSNHSLVLKGIPDQYVRGSIILPNGRMVGSFSVAVKQGTASIPLEGSAGLYFVKLANGSVYKIVK